ncbi:MAG TPA: hypothetical protein VFI24_08740 [Pyrinomonadaceae bacterium]|nr:hypothetical protein [Pyrinomonadaceae bacterium]
MPAAKILYSGFYDAPLAFVTSHQNVQYLFWRGFFDEQLDDYPNDYRVYVLPNLSEEQINAFWSSLPEKAIAYIGKVSLNQVAFDPTRREFIDTVTFDLIES